MRIQPRFIVYFVITVIVLGYIFVWDDSEAARQEKLLERELQSIACLPEVKVVSSHSGHKEGQATVSVAYVTNVSFFKIKEHYDKELAKNGWRLKSERDTTIWGKNEHGAKITYYEKGDYRLSLEYSGDNRGFTYALGLGWGIGN